MYWILFSLIAISLNWGTGFAQEILIDTIEVNMPKEELQTIRSNNFSKNTITSEDLEKLQPSNLEDILKTTTLATTTGGPRSQALAPQIRGMSSGKIFTYIDNERQSFRTDHTNVFQFEPSDLKEVEVHKTPGSSLYSNSLGGGIVLKTKDPSDYLLPGSDFGYDLNTKYQSSNDLKGIGGKAFNRDRKLETLVSLTATQAEDQKLSNKETLPNSSYEDTSVMLKLGYDLTTNQKLKFKYDQYNRVDPTPLNPTLNPPSEMRELGAENKTKRETISAGYVYKKFEFNAYETTQSLNKERLSDGEKENREVTTLGTSLSYIKNSFGVRGEFLKDSLRGSRGEGALESYPRGSSQNISLSTSYDHTFNKLTASALLTLNHYELESSSESLKTRSEDNLSKSLGLSYKVTNNLDVSFNYSEGYNAPKVQEVYADGLHHHGDGFFIADNFFTPNEKLKSETSQMTEVGFSYNKNFGDYDLLTVSANYFTNKARDYIYLEKIDRAIFDDEVGTTQFINLDKVDIYGSEYSIGYIYDAFETTLSYSQIRGRDVSRDLWISDLPADTYMLRLEYTFPSNLSLGYLGTQTLDQNRINEDTTERTDKTPGFLVHSAFLKKSFQNGLRITTRIDNLTNREYRRHGSNIYDEGMDLKLEFGFNHSL